MFGKSTITSIIISAKENNINIEIGEIAKKIKRGKNTTKSSRLFVLDENSYILDTPRLFFLWYFRFKERRIKRIL